MIADTEALSLAKETAVCRRGMECPSIALTYGAGWSRGVRTWAC